MAALMTPAQVAEEFGVSTTTVTAWADKGLIETIRTLGGHRRFRREDVERLLDRPAPSTKAAS